MVDRASSWIDIDRDHAPALPIPKRSKSAGSDAPTYRRNEHLAARREAGLSKRHSEGSKLVVTGLEELEVLFYEAKGRFLHALLFCVVVTVAWPILLALAIVGWPGIVAYVYTASVEQRRWVVQHAFAAFGIVALFLVYFGIPILFLMAQPQGVTTMQSMLATGEVGWVELCFYFGCFILLLVLVMYAWVLYGSVSLEVAVSLQSRFNFLQKHWQEELVIPASEKFNVFGKGPDSPVRVDDLLNVLGRYPGWKGSIDTTEEDEDGLVSDRTDPLASPQTSPGDRFTASGDASVAGSARQHRLSYARSKSTSHGDKLRSIDALATNLGMVGPPGAREFSASQNAIVFTDMVSRFLVDLLTEMPLKTTVTVIVCAALRAAIPRLWVWLYLGGSFLPGHAGEKIVVLTFMITTFIVTTLWLLLFNLVRRQYRHNVDQMLLVTALVSVERRHEYMRRVLRVDPEDMEHLLLAQKLPFLDLAHADNTRIWWAIREYAIVDSLDERVDLEVILAVALVYITMMSLYMVMDVVLSGHVTAFTPVCFFDLVVVGFLVLISLLGCVEVNELLRSHTSTILRARHTLWTPDTKTVGMAEAEVAEFMVEDGSPVVGAPTRVNPDAVRLHAHLIEKVHYADTLQTIFGYEVTSTNVAQLLVAIMCGIASAVFSINKAHNTTRALETAAAGGVALVQVVGHVVRVHAIPGGFLAH